MTRLARFTLLMRKVKTIWNNHGPQRTMAQQAVLSSKSSFPHLKYWQCSIIKPNAIWKIAKELGNKMTGIARFTFLIRKVKTIWNNQGIQRSLTYPNPANDVLGPGSGIKGSSASLHFTHSSKITPNYLSKIPFAELDPSWKPPASACANLWNSEPIHSGQRPPNKTIDKWNWEPCM